MRRLVLSFVTAASLAFAGQAAATTYYVSAGGSDANAGTSPAAAWRTVTRVDRASLVPGDSVLFNGGDTFTDATLVPSASGTPDASVTFSSFGSGRATISNADGAVWFAGKRYVTFANLVLTSGGASTGVFSGSPSGASDHITLRDSLITNSSGSGLRAPAGDSAWSIRDNTFSNLGDSALIIAGSDMTISGNKIVHVAWNTALPYGKHGIYGKGPNLTVADNDISDAPEGQAVSLRYRGARVYGNRIHDTPYGIAFFDDDGTTGASYVYGNRLWNLTGYGFYYDSPTSKINLVLASNTFSFAGSSEAVNVWRSQAATVTVVNNIFTGSFGSAMRGSVTTVERNNAWSGGATNLPSGTGDVFSSPLLSAAPILGLPTGSTLVDRGTTSVPVAYRPTCDDTPLSFCGSAPDLGAAETPRGPLPAPLPPPLPSPTALGATNVTATGLTLSWTAPADTRVVGYRVSSNGAQVGAPTAASFAVRGLTCGSSYSFTVVSVDVAGKTSPPAALTASSAACPLPEPTGLTAAARTATSVTLAWAKSTDTRVLSYRVSLNGTPVGTFTTATARVDSLVCGRSYSFSVVALGAAGTASVAATSTAATLACPPADMRAPKIAFIAPVADRVVPRALTVSASATDAGGIRQVEFSVDGVLVCADTTPDYSCPVTLSHGWHKLTARAIDRAGNAAATSIWVWAS